MVLTVGADLDKIMDDIGSKIFKQEKVMDLKVAVKDVNLLEVRFA